MEMTPEQWWKNYGMLLEIDAAGSFIYNALNHLHKIDNLTHTIDSFEILYGLSVGIERLQKVAIILLEHGGSKTIESLEKELISHNMMELSNRIDHVTKQNLSSIHKQLLSLLTKFYKSHRYGRFSFSSALNIDSEKEMFVRYLQKHFKIEVPENEMLFGIPNTDHIRKSFGKVVNKITKGLYTIIREKAEKINLYTYELRCDSKAMKVFLSPGKRLDFIDEEYTRKEMLLFLMDPQNSSKHMEAIRSFRSLNIEADSAPQYIKALINDLPEYQGYIFEEIEAAYHEEVNKDDISERFKMLDCMDTYIDFSDEYFEEEEH